MSNATNQKPNTVGPKNQATPKTSSLEAPSAKVNQSYAKDHSHTALLTLGGGLKVFWSIAVLVYAFLAPVHSTFKFGQGLLILALAIISGPLLPFTLTLALIKTKPPRTIKLLLLLNPDRELSAPLTDVNAVNSPNDLTPNSNEASNEALASPSLQTAQPKANSQDTFLATKYKAVLAPLAITALPCLLLASLLPFWFYQKLAELHGAQLLDFGAALVGVLVFLITVSAIFINGSFSALKIKQPHPFLHTLNAVGVNLVQLLCFSLSCAISIPLALATAHAFWAYIDSIIVNRYDSLTGLSPYLSINTLDLITLTLALGAIVYAMSTVIHKISDVAPVTATKK